MDGTGLSARAERRGLSQQGGHMLPWVRGSHIYILYVHPELMIGSDWFISGKGAGPLKREQRGSKRAQQRSNEGA